MSNANLTHWKLLVNPDYLGVYSLPTDESGKPKDIILTIDKVVREIVTSEGGKKEECTVVHFKEKQKPMILNRTNAKMISRLYDTPYIEQWGGHKIKVGRSVTKLKGEEVECLRVRDERQGLTLPVLQISDKTNFDKCKKALSNGYTVEDLKKKWTISQETEIELLT